MKPKRNKWAPEMESQLTTLKSQGKTWGEIAGEINQAHKVKLTSDAVKTKHRKIMGQDSQKSSEPAQEAPAIAPATEPMPTPEAIPLQKSDLPVQAPPEPAILVPQAGNAVAAPAVCMDAPLAALTPSPEQKQAKDKAKARQIIADLAASQIVLIGNALAQHYTEQPFTKEECESLESSLKWAIPFYIPNTLDEKGMATMCVLLAVGGIAAARYDKLKKFVPPSPKQ